MFTGIIEGQGILRRREAQGKGIVLELDIEERLTRGIRIGDSIALAGCCLTVTRQRGPRVSFDVIAETLQKTSLGSRQIGDRINLERALPADGRFNGHIVQGHVDGTGTVDQVLREQEDVRMWVRVPEELGREIVPKGSVALEGVSLTVVDSSLTTFSVALIPHTLRETTLGTIESGAAVNIEADVLGKYVRRLLAEGRSPG